MEDNLIIARKTAQAILNYLITQPYNQVWQLVEEMKKMEKAPDTEESQAVQMNPKK